MFAVDAIMTARWLDVERIVYVLSAPTSLLATVHAVAVRSTTRGEAQAAGKQAQTQLRQHA